jgi:protein-tyrosine phosphatase
MSDHSQHGEQRIRRATADDAAAIVALRDEAARWLLGRGIDQWHPGEVSRDDVLGWLSTGRVYIAERAVGVVGSVRLAWDDPAVWGEQVTEADHRAGYVQALVTSRSVAGEGLGRRLLAHVEQVIARSGRPLARLSCLRGNVGLERFYATAGYVEVGAREFPGQAGWEPVTLREKALPE